MKIIKAAGLGAIAVLGITTAALAQPANSRPQMPQMTPEQRQQMMSNGGMMSGTDMARMKDHCRKMMTMMGDKPAEARQPGATNR